MVLEQFNQREKLRTLHCDKCGRRNIYIERESVVGEGFLFLILGLATSMFVVGIPFILIGIVKIMRGYRFKVYCNDCGDYVKVNKQIGLRMLREAR